MPLKIIDKKGRLFGLVNLIDLFVLLTLLLLGAALLLRFTGLRDMRHEVGGTPVTVKVVINEVRIETVEAIEVGDVVRDATGGQIFGTVIDKQWEIHLRQVTTADGAVVWAEVPERYTVYVTVDARGHDLGHVLRIASHELRVGSSVTLFSRDYSVASTVLEYEIAE